MTDIATRLRYLRDANGWTVAEMSYRCGLPKRTLEKYMLRSNASLPGYEALIAISKGFGVSLDWLVFGSDIAGEMVELVADRCAASASLPVFDALLRYHREGSRKIFSNEEILGLSIEEWAAQIGSEAGEIAKKLSEDGVTKEDLLVWKQARNDRLKEILNNRFERIKSHEHETKRGPE
ncbi:helix-turn-helix domain-containing protein [Profundibacter sp.]